MNCEHCGHEIKESVVTLVTLTYEAPLQNGETTEVVEMMWVCEECSSKLVKEYSKE